MGASRLHPFPSDLVSPYGNAYIAPLFVPAFTFQ